LYLFFGGGKHNSIALPLGSVEGLLGLYSVNVVGYE